MTTYIGNKAPTGTKVEAVDDGLSYGTHTLPPEFWLTKRRGENMLSDADYRARRETKRLRHDKRREEKAEENRRRGSHK
jgi:hypothetical protein